MGDSADTRKAAQRLRRLLTEGKLAEARRVLGRMGARGQAPESSTAGRLDELCTGFEESLLPGTQACYVVRLSLSSVYPEVAEIAGRFASVIRGARQGFDELAASAGLCHVANAQPEDLLLLRMVRSPDDVGAVVLAGMATWADGDIHFEQRLARSYAQEPAVLAGVVSRCESAGVVVTFGQSDAGIPVLIERAGALSIAAPWGEPPALYLRPELRRRFKGRGGGGGLPTIERRLLGRSRSGCLPASRLGTVCARWLETGDCSAMPAVLHTNRQDLLSMAEATSLLLSGLEPAED